MRREKRMGSGFLMNKKYRVAAIAGLVMIIIAALSWYLFSHNIAVLEPRGVIAQKQRHLIEIGILLSCIVVLPVFGLTTYIALKYRESNKKAVYRPDWDHDNRIEFVWWAIPLAIITILSVITWTSSHALDPYKPLYSTSANPINIQVVSLDWKWLFIYPQLNVASVNKVVFPVNTPVNFQVTSDSVMNSFWVPQLGSQIYAMPGMSTQLHLMAKQAGSYLGSPANITGHGFSYMDFTAKAASQVDFNDWIETAENSNRRLDMAAYQKLARPSQDVPVSYYSSVENSLYWEIVNKYMAPAGMTPGTFKPMESM